MKIISIIPARGGSKGIPMKNLVSLKKKPLLYYTVSASLNSSLVNRTIVSTDNDKIANEARRIGAEVIKRPKILSNSKVAIEPTIKHALEFLKKEENYIPDVVVLLQNTSPLRTSVHIDNALKLFNKYKYDSVLSGFISHYLLWNLQNKRAIPINYNPLKRLNRQQMKNQFIENGAIYITKYFAFEKSNCRISGNIGFYEMPEEMSIQIDTRYDLLCAEQVMKKSGEI